jgi:hypothetical protein
MSSIAAPPRPIPKRRFLSRIAAVLPWLLLLAALPLAADAQEIGTATLVEGGLRMIRGTLVWQGAEGMRLRQGDIIETADSAFVQLEFDGGGIVALGPSTRAFLFRYSGGRVAGANAQNAAEFVLLSGWLKGESGQNPRSYRYASPALAGTTKDGALVLHATPGSSEIFVESGSAQVAAVTPNGNLGSGTSAKAGEFLTRRAGKAIETSSRPESSFIESVPRPFKDTLPSRLARFKGKAVAPKRDHEVTYAEIQPWLTIAQAWRRGFVQRFQPRLEDAAFRRAVEDHLQEHPEWDPVLHPEKQEPVSPAAPVHNSQSPSGRYSK